MAVELAAVDIFARSQFGRHRAFRFELTSTVRDGEFTAQVKSYNSMVKKSSRSSGLADANGANRERRNEPASDTVLALHGDIAAMPARKRAGDRETESGPSWGTRRIGTPEAVEDSIEIVMLTIATAALL